MTQSIPNSFSSDDLQALMEQAAERDAELTQSDDSDKHTYGSQNLTGEQMTSAALKLIEESFDICNDPVFHKAIVVELINNMVLWHTRTGESAYEHGEGTVGTSWLRDAGQFQAILALLDNITVGPGDFLCSHHECDDSCSH